ncbi:MAG: ABC transporter permease [Candidatus Moraniibacteriota bacterium]
MLKKAIFLIITLVLIIVAWQVIEGRYNISRIEKGETSFEAFVPSPKTVLRTFKESGGLLVNELFQTLQKAFLGFSIGLLVAVAVSSVFLFYPSLRDLLLPLFFAINSFPIIGLAPAIILIFGQGSWLSIIFVSMLISYFPILISLDTALRETDEELIELVRVFGANKIQTLLKVRLPLAAPYLFISMKIALPASIIGATIGEWLGSRNGIGQIITISLYQLKPGLLYASLLLIVFVSSLCIFLLSMLEYYLFPWRRKTDRK